MEIINKIIKSIEKYMAVIVLIIGLLALFFPQTFSVIKLSWINYLLMLIMFGMGLTLKLNDFKVVFTNPKPTRLIERIIKMGSKIERVLL